MSFEQYIKSPWRIHPAYSNSPFSMQPAPELASGEVILSALYREIGFEVMTEGLVPARGRDVRNWIDAQSPLASLPGGTLTGDESANLLEAVLRSPRRPGEAVRRNLQATPLVPSLATMAGAARSSGNPWAPGKLIRRMVLLGSEDIAAARELWSSLFMALSIEDNDDVFAKFVELELSSWSMEGDKTAEMVWKLSPLQDDEEIDLGIAELVKPAKVFVEDLAAIIAAKTVMTRRQWLSLLEAILRVAAVTHVLWVCDVQYRLGKVLLTALESGNSLSIEGLKAEVFETDLNYLSVGERAVASMKGSISRYLRARLWINGTLWWLEDQGVQAPPMISVQSLVELVSQASKISNGQTLVRSLDELVESQAAVIECKKGVGKNLDEFTTYALARRPSADPVLDGYDQGYFLAKIGANRNSPWVVQLGPVAILALAHCALFQSAGPRSVRWFSRHLGRYGLQANASDIPNNELGRQLRLLGVVMDSPDAESGMLLTPPFRRSA